MSEIQAQFRVDDFEKLKSGVESHKKLIEDSFTSADEDVGARIDELQLSISELKSQIAQCQQIVCRIWHALGDLLTLLVDSRLADGR